LKLVGVYASRNNGREDEPPTGAKGYKTVQRGQAIILSRTSGAALESMLTKDAAKVKKGRILKPGGGRIDGRGSGSTSDRTAYHVPGDLSSS